MTEYESRVFGAIFINRRGHITTAPLDDANLPEQFELQRKARIRKNGHIWLDDIRQALKPSYLSSYCKGQIMFELEEELLNRRAGEIDFVQILRIDPSYREVEIYTSPSRALEIEIDVFRAVIKKNTERERMGLIIPVNSSDWGNYIVQRHNEIYPRRT